MNEHEAVAKAREYFLERPHGCAEATCAVLQQAYGLPSPEDCASAMVFNGGVAWRGGICGVISGAALVVGRLSRQRIADHRRAKRVARVIVDRWIDQFEANYGSVNCRDLVGLDIHSEQGHRAFIESGVWRETCTRQIEFAVKSLFSLHDSDAWADVAADINDSA